MTSLVSGAPGRRDSFALKFQRAHQHFGAIQDAIRYFLSADPYRVVAEFNAQNDGFSINARRTVDVPPEMSVLAGDCLYNLRSTLDHLAWQLAVSCSGDGDAKTEFPVFLEREAYWETSKKRGRPTERSGLRKVQLLDPSAQTLIEGLQPYKAVGTAPADHPLWLLQQLGNEDKHRSLHLIGAVLTSGKYTAKDQAGRELFTTTRFGGYFPLSDDRTELEWIGRSAFETPPEEMHLDGRFFFSVAFDPGSAAKGQPVDQVLSGIFDFITSRVIPPLEPFL